MVFLIPLFDIFLITGNSDIMIGRIRTVELCDICNFLIVLFQFVIVIGFICALDLPIICNTDAVTDRLYFIWVFRLA